MFAAPDVSQPGAVQPVEVHVYTAVVFRDALAARVAPDYTLDHSRVEFAADGRAAIIDTSHQITVAPETYSPAFLQAVYVYVRDRALHQAALFERLDLVSSLAPPAPSHDIARDALVDMVAPYAS